ncbi:MAG: hypothetical protein MUC56_10575 [Thermoanaerobaculales bacterium]|jgi:hypothetical protein|nr:hypothetical protein [Thermoanaerobaculales bacterium]
MRLVSSPARVLVVAIVVLGSLAPAAATEVPTPDSVFGFVPGADRRLLDYGELVGYLEKVAAASPRVELREIGRSTLDRPMILVFVSSEANIARLDELREINRRLAVDPAIPDDERPGLLERGRVFLMATLSMHSSEVGPAQTLPLLVHRLATADDVETLGWLDDVVVAVVACLNPDGMDMMVAHYRGSLGTPYEGASMPGLYHHYVGHDNNRDFVTLNLAESRAVSRAYSTEWYPQVLIDKHQMGRTGPRYFVPRYHDPIAENVDGALWTWIDVFGSAMARAAGEAGLTGVASHWLFDDYWPGSTTTSDWKNVISLLTEAASCRIATPVFVEKGERRVGGKGLSEYAKSVNMPSPWPGGWWRLGDIVDLELASWRGAIATASQLREDILRFRNDLCRAEVERGRTVVPAYFVIPSEQHDTSERDHLAALLVEHGVEVSELAAPVEAAGRRLAAGDLVVSLAQPYRPFVKEVLEAQRYPVRRYTPDGEIIEPYDITSWSLPLHLGVEVHQLEARSDELEGSLAPYRPVSRTALAGAWGIALDPRDNASYPAVFAALGGGEAVSRATRALTVGDAVVPAGAFVVERPSAGLLEATAGGRSYPLDADPEVERRPLTAPRLALVETWFHDMDAGWTRLLLERSGIAYTLLRPGDIAGAKLASRFDVVIFPDADENVLLEGAYADGDEYTVNDYRPEYRKGIGDEGVEQLEAFLEAGGRIVSWGGSTALFLRTLTLGEGDDALELELPVSDEAEELEEKGLLVPGSLLAVELLADHPLTWGMPARSGVFSRGEPVLSTGLPMLATDRRVIAWFPDDDILLSGYAEEVGLLAGRPAMVWARVGRGQLVLSGFSPQFRASTPATYKLLFNALLLPRLGPDEGGVPGGAPAP